MATNFTSATPQTCALLGNEIVPDVFRTHFLKLLGKSHLVGVHLLTIYHFATLSWPFTQSLAIVFLNFLFYSNGWLLLPNSVWVYLIGSKL